MWMPDKVVQWLNVSLDTVNTLKEELAAVKAERDSIKNELTSLKIHADWLRMQINGLQHERTALLDKAYGIKIPTPELARAPVLGQSTKQNEFSFDDIGDDLAKKYGLPVYGS